ncbi:MAG: hypothetical protein H7A36_04780 [Chlamydiales bacterium]|nr:hypothetical protein [Chlamydiales bacterium]
MRIEEIPPKVKWVTHENGQWCFHEKRPSDRELNRETLAHFFISLKHPHPRALWKAKVKKRPRKHLPRIVSEDPFLRYYAEGKPLSVAVVRRLLKAQDEKVESSLNPISVEWNSKSSQFYDVVGAPPGFLSKFVRAVRLKRDKELTRKVGSDLALISQIDDNKKRQELTLSVLSHGAAYRELEGHTFNIPSFTEKGKLIAYKCKQHLIAEGVKTVSLVPESEEAPGLYLCQGTELWPSQPSMLGSLLANLGMHGSATEAYQHSWRRIHKHLRELKNSHLPIVAGHSMGGAMAIQIALYSHDLISLAFASNPPVPNERDFDFYQKLQPKKREKLRVIANLDDFAFWRIGAKVIGNVRIFLGKKRWRYYPIHRWEMVLFFPAVVKLWLNIWHAFPAHQHVIALDSNFLSYELTPKEIETENKERLARFDYLRFLPHLYDPTKILVKWIRRLFGWSLQDQYLRNEIEIIALHERELIDTMTESNRLEVEIELDELRRQKRSLLRQLKNPKNK